MPESSAFTQARQRAEALARSGDLDGARTLLERAVEIGRAQLAQGDAELLATMRQLADVQMRADDPMAARRTLEEAIEAGIRLGDTDPLMLMLSYDLGLVAEELANRHVARTNFTRVAELGPSVLGAGHPAVIHARTYLGPDAPALSSVPASSPGLASSPGSAPLPVQAPSPARVPSPGAAVSSGAAGEAGPVLEAGPARDIQPIPAAAAVPSPPGTAPLHQGPIPAAVPFPPSGTVPAPDPMVPAAMSGHGPAGGSRSRKSMVAAGAAVVAVTLAVTAIFVRTGGDAGSSVQAAPARVTLHDAGSSVMVLWDSPANRSVSAFTITGGPAGRAAQPLGETTANVTAFEVRNLDPAVDYCFAVVASYGSDGAATSPQSCTTREPPASAAPPAQPSSAAVPPSRSTTAPGAPRTPASTPARTATTTKAAVVRTRISSPAARSRVSWPFDATFTVSNADASATGTVLALSICVAGRCYLDGKVDVYDGVAAPYTVYLGSTKPEGTGAAWQLRLDRITRATYDKLVAERDASIAAGTWGNVSTRMNALNATPVSTLTVTKAG
ncbi:hypothetical protein AB0G04_34745 [Actinoplanes sp. NPDC023801]|uniref:hypothetical protein n=1 Tax=Actinoplanes sp. NPDC023801 TaxID=3154595 RepID=UPI0033EDA5AC